MCLYLLPVPWLHPSCLLWRFVFEKDTMWTLDIDTHTHTNTHTHTHCDMDIYFCCFSVWICYQQSYYYCHHRRHFFFVCLFVFPRASIHSWLLVYFVVWAAFRRRLQVKKKKSRQLPQQQKLDCWVCTLGRGAVDRGGQQRAGCAHLHFLWLTFGPRQVFSHIPNSLPLPSPAPNVLTAALLLLLFFFSLFFFYTHHLPADYKHLLIAHRYCSVLFLFPFFSLCYAVEIIKKNISRSVRKWRLFQ